MGLVGWILADQELLYKSTVFCQRRKKQEMREFNTSQVCQNNSDVASVIVSYLFNMTLFQTGPSFP